MQNFSVTALTNKILNSNTFLSARKLLIGLDYFYWSITVVFFLSGFSALIYQVVWQRALTLYYGVGFVSTTVVVSMFLFGLGVGALLGGVIAEKIKRLIPFYMLVEFTLGIIGLLSLAILSALIPLLSTTSYFIGGIIIAILVIVPTVLMGMTLPLIVKIMNGATNNFGHTISWLYFINTLGAAIGAFLGTYWFISWYGLEVSVYISAILNFLLVGIVWRLTKNTTRVIQSSNQTRPSPETTTSVFRNLRGGSNLFHNFVIAFTFIFFTGFLAIGYQIVSFRFIGTLLKPSAYTFSTILSIYLLGIAFGSLGFNFYLKREVSLTYHRLMNLFAGLNGAIASFFGITFIILYQFSQDGAIGWMLETSFAQQLHPPYNIAYAISGEKWPELFTSIYLLFDILIWPFVVLFIPALFMGASFSLVNVLSLRNEKNEGGSTGVVYGFTILGNVVGGLVTGFILLPHLGTEITLLVFVIFGLLWFGLIDNKTGSLIYTAFKCISVVICILAAWSLLPGKYELYDAIHPIENNLNERTITEGRDGVVFSMVGRTDGEDVSKVYIGGAIHASFPSAAFEVEVLEAFAHAKNVDNVLIIGFGGGNLTKAILRNPDVKNVTIIEISETLIDNLSSAEMYRKLLSDPRLNIVVDDGRRFLFRSNDKYDMILMDPLRSTSAYSNNLYSFEFFSLLSSRLNDDGLVMTWMNEYSVIPKTMAMAFNHQQCFYYFCLAGPDQLKSDEQVKNIAFTRIPKPMQKKMLIRMNKDYYYKGDRTATLKARERYPINRDFNPITEYYVGYTQKRF